MKRRWAALGGGLGLAIGVVAGPTLFADETSDKQPRPHNSEAVTAAQSGPTTFDTKFVAIDPARAFDSRIPTGPTGPNFVAVTSGIATGFTASAINFNGTSDVANAGIVSIDHNRTVRIWNGDQSGTTHVIIDITGYFVKPMYAEVARNGSVTAGSRVTSAQRFQAGVYDVTFDRNVTGCATTATIGDINTEPGGLIDVQTVTSAVRVFTADPDRGGAPTPALSDRAFYLVVTC